VQLSRLRREAEVLASLNHPNVGAIFGLEEQDGTHALVLELVEGETLAQRLAAGRLSIDTALSIAQQIAGALRSAHDRGIVHRDLKPANIKVRDDGIVKVLDFGLAKSTALRAESNDASPTLDAGAVTEPGLVVGTPAYMAPEQVTGRAADKRCDIWAFGCVLFEMLAGRRPFEGKDVPQIFAAVLASDPDWSWLPPGVSPSIRALLRRCLARDPQARLGDLAAAQFVLEEQAALAAAVEVPGRSRATTVLVALGAALIAAALAAGAAWLAARPPPSRVVRTSLVTTPSTAPSFSDWAGVNVAISPDGTWLAYVGNQSTQLFVHPLDAIDSRAIVTTPAYLRNVFVSEHGDWLGYVENNFVLRKVPVAGGAPTTVLTMDGPSRGATWSTKRGIVFATGAAKTGLQQVSPDGGPVTVVTRPDASKGEVDHIFPQLLPDDRHVLFTIPAARGGLDASQIAVLDLETGKWKTVSPAATTLASCRAVTWCTPRAERCERSPSTRRGRRFTAPRSRWRRA
jgi:serine/threonine-protein kinase